MALTIQEERKAAELAREMDEETALRVVQMAFKGLVKEIDILNAYLRREMRDNEVCNYFNTEAMRTAEDLGLPRHCAPLIAAIDSYARGFETANAAADEH